MREPRIVHKKNSAYVVGLPRMMSHMTFYCEHTCMSNNNMYIWVKRSKVNLPKKYKIKIDWILMKTFKSY
jgi:hypothetical protein